METKLEAFAIGALAKFAQEVGSSLFSLNMQLRIYKELSLWDVDIDVAIRDYEYLSQPDKDCFEVLSFSVQFPKKKPIDFIVERDNKLVSAYNQFVELSGDKYIKIRHLEREVSTTGKGELATYMPPGYTKEKVVAFVRHAIRCALTNPIIIQ